jgi:hypothetical protein
MSLAQSYSPSQLLKVISVVGCYTVMAMLTKTCDVAVAKH